MTHRDFPYHEGIRAKARHDYILHENKHKNHATFFHTFRKWSITWSQFSKLSSQNPKLVYGIKLSIHCNKNQSDLIAFSITSV